MEKIENLFWQVFNCNGENDLHKIVTGNEYFKNSDNWYPYGGKSKDDRSNFSIFENQQAHSGAALVEKITNSIDALLLKRCRENNIDPKSRDAPKTMEEATEQFFTIPKGDIGELPGKDRAKIAKDNIQIIATGDSHSPDLMIYDYGEGQHPSNFKNTFLSIANNNKTDIAFVQGKYNMGSTGAVVFCGKYRYQLIASKMNQNVFGQQSDHAENLFGWTVVRRHILTEEESSKCGSSWYEYFVIDGEKMPQFEIDELDIGLYDDKKFTTGSFIKLFSYEMPKGAKSAITQGLYQDFNQLLYKPALPIWLYEKRQKYESPKEIFNIAVYGNHVRINNPDRADDLLERPPIYEKLEDKDIGTVIVQAIVFRKGENQQQQSDRKRRYIGAGRNVIYTLNGQVQGSEGQSFITQELKYHFLKDSMLIVIDCSKIKTEFRQDLFMANRSNLRLGDRLEELKQKVIDTLKSNETLRELNTQRKNAILQGGDDKKEKERIESLLSKIPLDKSLTNLLKKGLDLVNLPPQKDRTSKQGKKQRRPEETKRFPSVFKINVKEDEVSGKKIKSIPLNGKGVIQFETDVMEDYFYRPQEKGEFQIHIFGSQDKNDSGGGSEQGKPNKVEDFFEVNQSGPSGGSIKLTLKPRKELSVGDEIELNAKLTSPDGDMESTFYVKIIDPKKQEKKNVEKEPEKPELPKIIRILKDKDSDGWKQGNGNTWDEVEEWDEKNIIHIIPAEEGESKIVSAIAINMDSHSLRKYLSKNNAKSEKDINYLQSQYISKIYLHGLFLYSILDKLKSKNNSEDKYLNDNQSSEDLLAQIFKNYSDVLIHLDMNKEVLDLIDNE